MADPFDTRHFYDYANEKLLTVSHGSPPNNRGAISNQRALEITITDKGGGFEHMTLSVDNAVVLIGGLQELVDAAAPRKSYVVDTSHGAYFTYARTEAEALVEAGKWASAVAEPATRPILVGSRVWEVLTT